VPTDVEFARTLVRLDQARAPQSPTDHIFSKATYVHDPNGILLEITLETPERCRSVEIGPHGVVMIDSEGRHRAGTEPLDVSAAVAPLAGDDPWLPLASASYVGHVHLHVPDLVAAHSFYRDVVGFQEHAYMTPIGMADLSAGGRFPHRMAVNNWHGPSAVQPPPGTAGMLFYELTLRDAGGLGGLVQRAEGAGIAAGQAGDGGVWLTDPAGNRLTVGERRG
jgi:catechol 2,3-dioxygenase